MNSGTPRKTTLNGMTFHVFADTNVSFKPSLFTTEGVPTTGPTMNKMTKVVPEMDSITIAASPADLLLIKAMAESLVDITMSIEFADGSVFKATGRINLDSWESETNKAAVKLIPTEDWTPFIA
jgi:hypothetical protein